MVTQIYSSVYVYTMLERVLWNDFCKSLLKRNHTVFVLGGKWPPSAATDVLHIILYPDLEKERSMLSCFMFIVNVI